ncbi:unnamed protein product [Mytilus coruscus]|uniref:Reverse transcriptase domain-containing protein n=1 Tax=Mytilus coruscus TaxID=42192 RepID=A0A6J8A713_MYTCO|nr:unnamed protein product [Mytilus coruscus]
MRLRQDKIAVLGYIESMFIKSKYQQITETVCDSIGGRMETDENPTEYRMTVNLFGATSSPSCCNYALKYTAEKFKDEFDTKVTDTVTKNMYVDDCLSSVDEVEKDRSKKSHEWSLSNESGVERTLGVYWFVNDDKLVFHINRKHKPQTRHGILSVVRSVYDPIGIAFPFVLAAKFILQSLCTRGIAWDEEIPDKKLTKWNK